MTENGNTSSSTGRCRARAPDGANGRREPAGRRTRQESVDAPLRRHTPRRVGYPRGGAHAAGAGRERVRVLGRQPGRARPPRGARPTRLPHPRIPRRTHHVDPRRPAAEGSGRRLRHRLPRRARPPHPRAGGTAKPEDRHERRRDEPARLCGEGAGRARAGRARRAARRRRQRRRPDAAARRTPRRRPRAEPPRHRRAARRRARPRRQRQRLPRRAADRGRAEARRRRGRDRARRGRVAHGRPGGARVRLGLRRPRPPRRGDGRRAPHRVWCAGDRRAVDRRRRRHAPRNRRLPDRRGRPGRRLHRHQARAAPPAPAAS